MTKSYGGILYTICGKIARHFRLPTKTCIAPMPICTNCQTKGEAAKNRN